MKKILITLLTLLLLVSLVYGATVYKSISVTEEAKAKIVTYSKVFKISQRDTASKMILEWEPLVSPFKGFPYKAEYVDQTCWMNEIEYASFLEAREKIAQGITVYEVVDGDRCIDK